MSSSIFIETTQAPSTEIGDYRLVWGYAGDRWGHRVQVRRDGEWIDLLKANANGGCVLQDLFLEQRPDGSAEFQGMGQSAAGIHSASILCNPDTRSITFDLATRFRELGHVAHLRMEYHRGDGLTGAGIRVEALATPKVGELSISGEVPSGEITRIEWKPPTGELPRAGRPGGGLTVQWGYRMQFPLDN